MLDEFRQFTRQIPPIVVGGAGLFVLIVLILLPPYFYRALIIMSPAVIGFVSIGWWIDSGAIDDENALFSALRVLALSLTIAILIVHLALLLFGNGLFSFRGILTTVIGLVFTVTLPAFGGGLLAYGLMPQSRSISAGLMGMGLALGLILVDALIDIPALTILLFLLAPAVTIYTILRVNQRDISPESVRGGLVAGGLTSLLLCVALSITVRVVACVGAVACAEQMGLVGVLIFYAVVLAVFVINLGVLWLVGALTVFILRLIHG